MLELRIAQIVLVLLILLFDQHTAGTMLDVVKSSFAERTGVGNVGPAVNALEMETMLACIAQ